MFLGRGEAAALPPSTKEEVGSIYKGGGRHTALVLLFRSRYTSRMHAMF